MAPRYWNTPGGPDEAMAILRVTDYKVTRGMERKELDWLIANGELTQEEADGRQAARDRINVAQAVKFGHGSDR